MSTNDPIKLIPRNMAALRRGQVASVVSTVSGNSVGTRLESGVGNCFPGLECDLRNLERRFFPMLEVDIEDAAIIVVGVDIAAVDAAAASGALTSSAAETYRRIDADAKLRRFWRVRTLRGTFGPLGVRDFTIANFAQDPAAGGSPPDAWTAIRLLTEGSSVELTMFRASMTRTLTGARQRYLDDNGALAAMFVPGELTQSLCSPWTHDFRDCGCFYWASNHPDIAQPALPTTAPAGADWNIDVPWERSNRIPDVLPEGANASAPTELDHYEINHRWQELNFVLEGRETLGPYSATASLALPFTSPQELESQLRYAAGVELAVMQMYLSAAFSLRDAGATPTLTADITAARAEIMRIAIGEMRHLRLVNNVLASMAARNGMAFLPALRIATRLPGEAQPWRSRPAGPDALADFVRLEAPSTSIDGLYARILATLERDGTDEEEQSVRSIIAEGEDHFQTFEFVQEWLGRHQTGDYLRSTSLARPPATNAQHRALQQQYNGILAGLYEGYRKGLPGGANDINNARTAMVQTPGGLAAAAQAIASAGFLVVFDAPTDARFVPIAPP